MQLHLHLKIYSNVLILIYRNTLDVRSLLQYMQYSQKGTVLIFQEGKFASVLCKFNKKNIFSYEFAYHIYPFPFSSREKNRKY